MDTSLHLFILIRLPLSLVVTSGYFQKSVVISLETSTFPGNLNNWSSLTSDSHLPPQWNPFRQKTSTLIRVLLTVDYRRRRLGVKISPRTLHICPCASSDSKSFRLLFNPDLFVVLYVFLSFPIIL